MSVAVRLLAFVGLLAIADARAAYAQFDEDVPCTQVVAELNRRITRGQARGVTQIAKSLEIEPRRVEECLAIHGRRIPRARVQVVEPERENPFRDTLDTTEPQGFQEFFEPVDPR